MLLGLLGPGRRAARKIRMAAPPPVTASAVDGTRAQLDRIRAEVEHFYTRNPQIKASHGIEHVTAVHAHSVQALACCDPPLPPVTSMEIQAAALLHDTDDRKYFGRASAEAKQNARDICARAGIDDGDSVGRIVRMIEWVGCAENGNRVPADVEASGAFHLLIPRWSDRLEAVGARGVVRCHQFNEEHGYPLSSEASPRATTREEVFRLATPDRFERYTAGGGNAAGGQSDDMISHYYDKLLHIARPPPDIVRNRYLEGSAEAAAEALVEVCVRFGRTGAVDQDYIRALGKKLSGAT